ncbi:MAG: T9SS type A sorting domain-containing protein [Saprospiraceae bacterium]|nr:T9SS type A sorting domain-containing protein [Saprospiraceae bacterium]
MIRIILFLIWVIPIHLISQKINFTKSDTYQRHTELSWSTTGVSGAEYFRIMRSEDRLNFSAVKTIITNEYMDFSDPLNLDTFFYFVVALNGLNQAVAYSDTIKVSESEMSDEALMEMVQRYTFRYFWDDAHPVSGMAKERNSSGDVVTTGGSGFGIMSILVGIENGFITRSEGVNRIIKIISFLQYADRFHGVFPHWMNGRTGKTIPFSQYDNGGDLVETAFLMEGLLSARQFFDQNNAYENAIRQIITTLYEDVEWNFYTKNNSGVLYWHWSPNFGWQMNFPLRGYNEAMIVYILSIASPTHPIPVTYWNTGWTANSNYKNGNTWFGHKLFVGPPYGGPLFFSHYSFIGFDPRGIKDKNINYFDNNRNHTLINRGYCIANPLNHKKYSSECWGLTASDDPWGYSAHEPGNKDNGTIAPTAALSSMPYTPAESMDALKYFYFSEGDLLFGKYGFYDAFNGNANWYADSYLSIDQGPIICMIQNHRTELLWKMFMKNPEIQPALDAIGFVKDPSANVDGNGLSDMKFNIFPNPSSGFIELFFDEDGLIPIKVEIYSNSGNLLLLLNENIFSITKIETDNNWQPGVYYVVVHFENNIKIKKLVLL